MCVCVCVYDSTCQRARVLDYKFHWQVPPHPLLQSPPLPTCLPCPPVFVILSFLVYLNLSLLLHPHILPLLHLQILRKKISHLISSVYKIRTQACWSPQEQKSSSISASWSALIKRACNQSSTQSTHSTQPQGHFFAQIKIANHSLGRQEKCCGNWHQWVWT